MLLVVPAPQGSEVRLEEVPPPLLEPGGLLLRTCCTLIDPRPVAGLTRPRPAGLCGLVAEAWPDSPLRVGAAVVCAGRRVEHAEQTFVPYEECVPVPPGLDPADAVLAPVGALALEAMRRAGLGLGDVAVICGLGLLGLLCVQLARAAGCRVIAIDPNGWAAAQAQQAGADLCLVDGRDDLEGAVQTLTYGEGAGAVLVCADDHYTGLAAALCRRQGRVVVAGSLPIQAATQPYGERDLDLRVVPLAASPESAAEFLRLLAAGRMRPDLIHLRRFPVTEAARAYAAVAEQAATEQTAAAGDHPAAVPSALLLEFPRHAPVAPTLVLPGAARAVKAGEIGVAVVAPDGAAQATVLPALQRVEGVRIRTVAGVDGLLTRRLAQRYGAARCSADLAEVLSDPQIHAVMIFGGEGAHGEWARQALAAGKHVYTGQPLAADLPELAALAEARQRAERVLWSSFHRRYAPLVAVLAERLSTRSGPLMAQLRVCAPEQPGPGSAAAQVAALSPYVDLALLLIGARRVLVRAVGLSSPAGAGACNLQVLLAGEDGSAAGLLYTRLGPVRLPRERIEVLRGDAAGVMEDFAGLTWAQAGRLLRFRRGAGDWGHLEELRQFVRALKGGGDDGFAWSAMATATTLAVLEALRSGQVQETHFGQLFSPPDESSQRFTSSKS